MNVWLVVGLVTLACVVGWLLHRKFPAQAESNQALKAAAARRADAEKKAREKHSEALQGVRRARAEEVERLVRNRDALHDRLDAVLGKDEGGDPPAG